VKFLTVKSKSLELASADELRALRKKLRGPLDRATAYTKEGSTYPSRAYPTIMTDVIAILPEFKKEQRECEKLQKVCAKKQKNLGANLAQALGHIRGRSVISAANSLLAHINLIEGLLNVHKSNALKK
jgi:hypothetical protein